METIIGLTMIALIASVMAIRVDRSNIISPIGMLMATFACTFLITPMFEESVIKGWGMVFITLLYYASLVIAIKSYFRLNKI